VFSVAETANQPLKDGAPIKVLRNSYGTFAIFAAIRARCWK
jgi:hypothetical protein